MFDLEQILYLLAARGGAIGRSSLEKAIAEFGRQEPALITNGWSRLEALWALDLLGHCETTGHKGRFTIALACASLARLPGLDKSRAVLAGARSAATLTELQEACKNLGHGRKRSGFHNDSGFELPLDQTNCCRGRLIRYHQECC